MWPHSHCKSSGSLTCVSVTAPLVSIGIAPSFCTASIGKGTVQTLTGWFHWSRGNWAIYSTRFVTQLVLTGSSRPARVLSSLIGSVLIQPTCDWIDSLFNWWLFAIEAIKSRGASQWSWFSHLVCLFVCLLCLIYRFIAGLTDWWLYRPPISLLTTAINLFREHSSDTFGWNRCSVRNDRFTANDGCIES